LPRDYRLAFGSVIAIGFSTSTCLPAPRRARMGCMQLVRRGDVNRLDRGIGAERLGALVGAAELALEQRPRLGARIGGSDEPHAPIGHEGLQHQGEGAAKADHAELQDAVAHAFTGRSLRRGVFARDTQIMICRQARHRVAHQVAVVSLTFEQPGLRCRRCRSRQELGAS